MTDDTACFELPAAMKIEDCERFHAFLVGAQAQNIRIDCHKVEKLSGLGAQLLLMANTWRQNAREVTLVNPSPGLIAGVAMLGLSNELQLAEVTQ